ncbi:MAG: hypothetical protein CM15mP45_16420 [Deltaproteobacteria bacterium]|nr:MAG: hypothetical protein CM15mP45_16420 [Deltaproteobacteria bacterium]
MSNSLYAGKMIPGKPFRTGITRNFLWQKSLECLPFPPGERMPSAHLFHGYWHIKTRTISSFPHRDLSKTNHFCLCKLSLFSWGELFPNRCTLLKTAFFLTENIPQYVEPQRGFNFRGILQGTNCAMLHRRTGWGRISPKGFPN